jgi:hypothetical protein
MKVALYIYYIVDHMFQESFGGEGVILFWIFFVFIPPKVIISGCSCLKYRYNYKKLCTSSWCRKNTVNLSSRKTIRTDTKY